LASVSRPPQSVSGPTGNNRPDTYLRDATLGFGFITLGVLIEGFLYQFTGLTLTQVHVAESVCLVFGLGILLRSFLD